MGSDEETWTVRGRRWDRWLAAHDAKVQAEALREFAQSIPGDVHDPRHVADLARGVADHIEREAGPKKRGRASRGTREAALAVFEQASTPTDEPVIDDGTDDAWQAIADALGNIGYALNSHEQTAEWVQQYLFCRTVQGEPADNGHDGWCGCETCVPEPQGEPSDAQVKAALHALYAIRHPYSAPGEIADYGDEVVTAMRAALRAAARVGVVGQGGENHG